MAKAKITITGELMRSPVIKADGTVDLYFKTEMSEAVPRGLKSLGASFAIAHVGPKAWKSVKDDVQENSFFIIQGESVAAKNSKGVSFMDVITFEIVVREPKAKLEAKPETTPETTREEDVKPEMVQAAAAPEQNGGANIVWYSPEEVIMMPLRDITLTENTHLYPGSINFMNTLGYIVKNGSNSFTPLAVRPIEEGRYSLVMGIRNYISACIANLETVPVVIRDMTHSEMMKTYGFSEKPNFYKKKKK